MTLKKRKVSKRNSTYKMKKGGGWGSPIELINQRQQQGGSRKRKIQTGGKWSDSKVSWLGLF